MSAALTFHVPPDAGPEPVQAIFHVLARAGEAPLAPAMLKEEVAAMLGKQARGEALSLARDLDLVRQIPNGVLLTPRGRSVAGSAEPSDLVHGFSYFAWSDGDPAQLSRMWTYRTTVDLLWQAAPVTVDPPLKKRLVEDLLGRSEQVFAGIPGFSAARASLGPKSIDGVLRWLERLSPTVLRDRCVERRQRCAPALLVLALEAVARRAGAAPGTDFRLGPDEREGLCRACILEPAALDAMLNWTMQTQPHRVRWGTTNARYGRQLVIVSAEDKASKRTE